MDNVFVPVNVDRDDEGNVVGAEIVNLTQVVHVAKNGGVQLTSGNVITVSEEDAATLRHDLLPDVFADPKKEEVDAHAEKQEAAYEPYGQTGTAEEADGKVAMRRQQALHDVSDQLTQNAAAQPDPEHLPNDAEYPEHHPSQGDTQPVRSGPVKH